MPVNLPTFEDLKRSQKETIEEIKRIFNVYEKIPKLLTGREVCKMLRLSAGKLKIKRDNGEIEFIDTGKKYLYELKAVLDYIERNRRNKKLICIIYCLLSSYLDAGLLCA